MGFAGLEARLGPCRACVSFARWLFGLGLGVSRALQHGVLIGFAGLREAQHEIYMEFGVCAGFGFRPGAFVGFDLWGSGFASGFAAGLNPRPEVYIYLSRGSPLETQTS